jgi:hypothetical protein
MDGGQWADDLGASLTSANAQNALVVPLRESEVNLNELRQEMKVLHWHKLANEAALKAALISTKRLKDREKKQDPRRGHVPPPQGWSKAQQKAHIAAEKEAINNTRVEKVAWMRKIIEDEQRKPLEVSQEFIRKFVKTEKAEEERHEASVGRHVKSLRKVKTDLENRKDASRRNLQYREKKAILDGFIARSRDPTRDPRIENERLTTLLPGIDGRLKGQQSHNQTESKSEANSASLSKVIQSLDKLVDLEHRIATLERGVDDDEEEDETDRRSHASARRNNNNRGRKGIGKSPSAKNRTFAFTKKRTNASLSNPSKTSFHVKVQQRSARGRGRSTVKKGKADAFLTGVPDDGASVASRRSHRSIKSTRSTLSRPGVGAASRRSHEAAKTAYRHAPRTKSVPATPKRRILPSKKGTRGTATSRNTAMNSRTRQGLANAKKRNPGRNSSVTSRTKGGRTTARGSTSAKDHLKQFHEIRRQFDKKKKDMTRNLHRTEPRLAPTTRRNSRSRTATRGVSASASIASSRQTSGTTRAKSRNPPRAATRGRSAVRQGANRGTAASRSQSQRGRGGGIESSLKLGVYGSVVRGSARTGTRAHSSKPTTGRGGRQQSSQRTMLPRLERPRH